jgi:hypothetical protein
MASGGESDLDDTLDPEYRIVPDEVQIGVARLADTEGVGDAVVLRCIVRGEAAEPTDGEAVVLEEAAIDIGFAPFTARQVMLGILRQLDAMTPLEPQYDSVRLSGPTPVKAHDVVAELFGEMFDLGPGTRDELVAHLQAEHACRAAVATYDDDDLRALHRQLHVLDREEAEDGRSG